MIKDRMMAKQRLLQITLTIAGGHYRLTPGGEGMVRLHKLGDDTYHTLTLDGGPGCSCQGFRRHGHCKHADAIRTLAEMLSGE